MDGTWGEDWKRIEVPDPLSNEFDQLLSSLQGMAPSHKRDKDIRGWGLAGSYSVKEGYGKLLSKLPSDPFARMWKKIWKPDSPPKINTFN